MVNSQDLNRTSFVQNSQPGDDSATVAFLSAIETDDLLREEVPQLDPYQELIMEFPLMMENTGDQGLDQKPQLHTLLLDHLNKTPTLDEHDDSAFNFNVDLNGETSGKSSWLYSSQRNKVFVKMNQSCTFNISYQSSKYSELFVRAMLVCSAPEDIHNPVFRCENHRFGDNNNPNLSEGEKMHVMRCLNPSAQYVGNHMGVAFKDRLAVIIPLGKSTKEQGTMNVSLEFVCQNSCRIINRKPTAIIFTLEDAQGQICGKKSLHLKVCSCPKRDKQKEEESVGPTKRKSDTQLQEPASKKIAKVTLSQRRPSQQNRNTPSPTSGKLAYVKRELSSESVGKFVHKARSVTPSNSLDMADGNGIPLTLNMPTVELAAKVAEYAFQVVAGELIRNTDNGQQKKLAAFLTNIRRVQKRLSTSRSGNSSSSTDSD